MNAICLCVKELVVWISCKNKLGEIALLFHFLAV